MNLTKEHRRQISYQLTLNTQACKVCKMRACECARVRVRVHICVRAIHEWVKRLLFVSVIIILQTLSALHHRVTLYCLASLTTVTLSICQSNISHFRDDSWYLLSFLSPQKHPFETWWLNINVFTQTRKVLQNRDQKKLEWETETKGCDQPQLL